MITIHVFSSESKVKYMSKKDKNDIDVGITFENGVVKTHIDKLTYSGRTFTQEGFVNYLKKHDQN